MLFTWWIIYYTKIKRTKKLSGDSLHFTLKIIIPWLCLGSAKIILNLSCVDIQSPLYQQFMFNCTILQYTFHKHETVHILWNRKWITLFQKCMCVCLLQIRTFFANIVNYAKVDRPKYSHEILCAAGGIVKFLNNS